MITNTTYECERCNKEFHSESQCQSHEQSCGVTEKFQCSKCGKAIEYFKDERCDFRANECWSINLGRAGYGSGLDGCDVSFDLCDDCLIELVHSFTIEGREAVENSGCNRSCSTDQWIRMESGEMSDEETEELGYYSKRQIKAYNEQFPVCDKVIIKEYSDGSKGSSCFKDSFGDELGNTGLNIGDSCFQCSDFIDRGANAIPVVKEEQ